MATPKVLVSYAQDGEDHQAWVEDLAARLRKDGVDVILDVWSVQPGDDLAAFMEKAIRESDFVVVVGTPKFKLRSDGRAGGVGYESAVIFGELLAGISSLRKFVPLLRTGAWKASGPARLLACKYIDMRLDPEESKGYVELRDTLLGRINAAPPLGSPPAPSPAIGIKEKRVRKGAKASLPAAKTKIGRSAAAKKLGPAQREILRILKDVQSGQRRLSGCAADALALALSEDYPKLRLFCEREIRGLKGPASFDRRSPDFPSHRVFEMYMTLDKPINGQFFGWEGQPEKVFAFMDANPRDYQKLKILTDGPLNELEDKAALDVQASATSIRAWISKVGDILPNFARPDLSVHCYARRGVDRRVVDAARGELTRLLLDLLPPMNDATVNAMTEDQKDAVYRAKYGTS
jgi:hypothetical protein